MLRTASHFFPSFPSIVFESTPISSCGVLDTSGALSEWCFFRGTLAGNDSSVPLPCIPLQTVRSPRQLLTPLIFLYLFSHALLRLWQSKRKPLTWKSSMSHMATSSFSAPCMPPQA